VNGKTLLIFFWMRTVLTQSLIEEVAIIDLDADTAIFIRIEIPMGP
jgi:hypothetical protein